jgi:hypothetical protein
MFKIKKFFYTVLKLTSLINKYIKKIFVYKVVLFFLYQKKKKIT